jgi:predicted DCC family thiol-disulfide oxidoreductase YuxK
METRISGLMPISESATKNAQVFYDGQCRLCQKSVALLKKLDWRKVLVYVDVREKDHPAVKTLPVSNGQLLQEMHVLTPRKEIHHGFYAFRWMAWKLPLLWPVVPFLYLPGIPKIGQRVYLWVARNRFRLVPCHGGVCTIQKQPEQTETFGHRPN